VASGCIDEQIRTLEWQHVSFVVLLALVTVAVLDTVSVGPFAHAPRVNWNVDARGLTRV
jgi:hypothetical protein